jgi:hypothetical protein
VQIGEGDRKGKEKKWFRVANLKVGYGAFVMTTVRGKRGRRTKEKAGKQECKIVIGVYRKTTNSKKLHHKFSSNKHRYYIRIADFLLLF